MSLVLPWRCTATPYPLLENLFSAQGWELAMVFRAESCFFLAASLCSSRRSQEWSSNHLPKFRASNWCDQDGGKVKDSQVPQLSALATPQQWWLKAPLISLHLIVYWWSGMLGNHGNSVINIQPLWNEEHEAIRIRNDAVLSAANRLITAIFCQVDQLLQATWWCVITVLWLMHCYSYYLLCSLTNSS